MIKVLELFAGIGACSKALTNLGIEHEIMDAVEIDKYAIKSFNAVHGTNFEPQDITKWDKDIKVDLIMHGSPCQDFSIAGKQAGGDKDSGTRSSLMYETLRIVEKLQPKYVIWENVKNLVSKKHVHNYLAYIKSMNELGYKSYGRVLNAKDYGIPQNRERVFTVSFRERKREYEWPTPMPLERKLSDMLEKNVEEKYYLTEKQLACYMMDGTGKYPRRERFLQNMNRKNQHIGNSITTRAGSRPTDNYVAIKTANSKGYDLAEDGDGIDLGYPDSTTRRGRVGHGVSKTITTSDGQGTLDGIRIRKLTPKECWRLMGFNDTDFKKAEKVNSNCQLYKQAGNSIVVDVLMAILENLLTEEVCKTRKS